MNRRNLRAQIPSGPAISGHGRGGWQLFARLLVWAVRNSRQAL